MLAAAAGKVYYISSVLETSDDFPRQLTVVCRARHQEEKRCREAGWEGFANSTVGWTPVL